MKQIKKINIRKFSREMYSYLNKLPLAVYNKRTGELMFVVISAKKGIKLYEISAKDNL